MSSHFLIEFMIPSIHSLIPAEGWSFNRQGAEVPSSEYDFRVSKATAMFVVTADEVATVLTEG